ncbi:nucleotide exchange factor GrpE [Candidatus Nitrosocosmicus franklandus]|uniref:Heat shock protein GrpE n=1 Tax=Candidatus Nitrosocosmicus franklandianus TaxID=1798806 RepID=A0A484IC49_9ARCH|nr:nucleotide exchange factor GrpE [Candidatus Nitrosocosmicus franklandus]VFJ13787.1 Heat shock protein GrpE [Candidatus Nitrosocosmicus franklandus]
MDKTDNKDQPANHLGDDHLLLDDNSTSNNSNSTSNNENDSNTDLTIEELSGELKITRDELEHYRNLYDDTFNKLKYTLADFDNYRKNIEKQNTLKILSVKAEMMSTIINLREDFVRALDTLKHHKVDSSILEGLSNILKNIDIYLEKEDVKEIRALNTVFDPNFHEIVGFSYFENGMEENIITKEIRKGYLLNERVLRPSLVEVSKKIIKNIDSDIKENAKGDDN